MQYQVRFYNISDTIFRDAFYEALEGYPELHSVPLKVVQKPIAKTTMRARPTASLLNPFLKNGYSVVLSNNTKLSDRVRMDEVPYKVLVGWFAHELGHVMDYQKRSFAQMAWFGLQYLTSHRFVVRTEKMADLYAIHHGFGSSILETKRYILEHSELPERYKERIKKFYLSHEDAEKIIEINAIESLKMDDLVDVTPL